jgi:uncharacterized protein YigA (DUF484 family)
MVWAWNRLHGRRDIVLLQATLRTQPIFGFEIYRPGTILAGDSRHFAAQEGWSESALDQLVVAAPGEGPRQTAVALVRLLNAEDHRLVRLGVRRQGQHLTVALNVPDPSHFDSGDATRLVSRLADRVMRTQ